MVSFTACDNVVKWGLPVVKHEIGLRRDSGNTLSLSGGIKELLEVTDDNF